MPGRTHTTSEYVVDNTMEKSGWMLRGTLLLVLLINTQHTNLSRALQFDRAEIGPVVSSSSTTDSSTTESVTDTQTTQTSDTQAPTTSITDSPPTTEFKSSSMATESSSSTTATTPPSVVVSDMEKYTRTKTAFKDIQNELKKFNDNLQQNREVPALLQPASLMSLFKRHSSRQVTTDPIDNICSQPQTQACTELQDNLKDIDTLTGEFNSNPSTWTTSQMQRLEGDNKKLNTSLTEVSTNDIQKESFNTFYDEMNKDLEEGIKKADNKIDDINKTESDSIIFVAVFGSIGGLMVVALFAGMGFVIYKKKAVVNKSGKKKSAKMPGDNIPLESSHSPANFDVHNNPADSHGRSPPPRHPPLQRNVYKKPTADPYSRPAADPYSRPSAPRRDDIYSRPHASRSDRYYTPDDVRSGNQQSRRPQGGGLPRVY
ncbi:hypothetical protein Pmani_007640 [Petrolisthes manimaculis]|uniref:Uncharacterized protein n=1 Tax=Petrolisthes manimaculis TaxID=1843537 RepID=A0AAE1Q796_9EUCA|nr:hypothetical protein Pmani_007640 [Petrolisthes manimaculis]